MQKLSYKLSGTTPLMIRNIQLANPFCEYTKKVKSLTGKRNKTDADQMEIARVEWEGSFYINDNEVVMPGKCLAACFFAGARKHKYGPLWRTGVQLDKDFYPLDYQGPKIKFKSNGQIPNPDFDKYFDKFCNLDMVGIGGKSKTLRARPIFHGWSVVFTIFYDENIIDERTLTQCIETAGYMVGLCERRPEKGGQLGRFEVEAVTI